MAFGKEGEGMKKGRRSPEPTGESSSPPRLLPRQPDPNLTELPARRAVKHSRRLKDIFPHV